MTKEGYIILVKNGLILLSVTDVTGRSVLCEATYSTSLVASTSFIQPHPMSPHSNHCI